MEQNLSVLEIIGEALSMMTWVEIVATLTGLVYVVLAVKENIWCWIFGIVSSALSIYLFFTGRLYADAVLYFYYVIAGFYGWYAWTKQRNTSQNTFATEHNILQIHTWDWKNHVLAIGFGILLSFSLAFVLKNYTNADIPLVDSFTTIFSFIATYMVTRKVLETWLYWVVIDMVATGMYFYKGYYLYTLLMIIYTVVAAIGFFNWLKLSTNKKTSATFSSQG